MRKPKWREERKHTWKATEWGVMTAAVTAGGENESMGGIDLVNSRQWSETNCIMLSPKLGQTGREEERDLEGGVRMMLIEGGRGEMPTDFINCKMNSKPWEVHCCQRKESQTIQRAAWRNTHTQTHTVLEMNMNKCFYVCGSKEGRPLFIDADSVSCLSRQRSGRRLRCWIVTETGSFPNRSSVWPCARWVTCPVRWSWPSSCRD